MTWFCFWRRYGRNIFPNLYSSRFCRKRATEPTGKGLRDEVFKYMSGIITNKGQKPIIVNGVDDHVHAFIGLKPSMALSDLVRNVKNNSTNFINDHAWINGKFSWQEGYGAFSYSHSQIENVFNYILNQEAHHSRQTFKKEYMDFLEKFEIEHDVKYLFEWIK
jgi:putative transposase